jgi:riboflavin biosynthesis pyrimidine reductase
MFGANTAQQTIEAGLLDEIVIHVAPVLLGDGVRLYGGPGTGRVNLERTAVAESGPVLALRYRVVKRVVESRLWPKPPRLSST